jgi:hypothetical protein
MSGADAPLTQWQSTRTVKPARDIAVNALGGKSLVRIQHGA